MSKENGSTTSEFEAPTISEMAGDPGDNGTATAVIDSPAGPAKPKKGGKPKKDEKYETAEEMADRIAAKAAGKKKTAQAELDAKRKAEAVAGDAKAAEVKAEKEAADAEHKAAILAGWNPEPPQLVTLNGEKDSENGLTFDPRLQMRAMGKALVDESVAEKYAETMQDVLKRHENGTAALESSLSHPLGFAPIKAVRISEAERVALKLPSRLIVWEGFHTGRAAHLSKLSQFSAEVMDGSFKFAKFLAFGANARHGLNRTTADSKKAFYALINDPEMLADVVEIAENSASGREGGKGGMNRALAHVAGISTASVSRYLAEEGLTTSGNKIVKARAKPETSPSVPPVTTETSTPPAPPPVNYSSAPDLSAEQLAAASAIDLIESMQRLQAAMERQLGELLSREDTLPVMLAAAQECGVPFSVTTRSQDGESFTDASWPIMTSMVLTLDQALIAANALKGAAVE